jgi:hypothetical protein
VSKASELDICVGELRNAARSLTAAADNLAELFSGREKAEPATIVKDDEDDDYLPLPEKTPPTKPAAQSKASAKPKTLTFEQVRAILAEKSRSGNSGAIKGLIAKHGADMLSEVNPKEYAALIAEVEALPDE